MLFRSSRARGALIRSAYRTLPNAFWNPRLETRMDGPRCIVSTNLETTLYFPFCRQRVKAPRSLVLYISFPAASEYGFVKEEAVDRWREEEGNFFSGVMKERERGVDLFLPHILGGLGWIGRYLYPLPL